ncbi:MarR family winged helix-turn-helix transcriptional regulator [Microbacterium sp. YY-01]|uniref:MarR family winged helix-turn-helix transcriptional regulator n=1 Tax=Microbacterium sp. YY-01 TaxID=3421634 RepID=UPI003D178431
MVFDRDDVATDVVQALALLRQRQRRPGEPRGRGDSGHGDRAHGDHGHRGHAHGGGHERNRRRAGMAAMARGRMLEVLATSGQPMAVSAIGEAIGVDQPRASRLVQQGVEEGFVERQADTEDARRTLIALTDAGRETAHRMHRARHEAMQQALAGFSAEEAEQLARLLTRLAEAWPQVPAASGDHGDHA